MVGTIRVRPTSKGEPTEIARRARPAYGFRISTYRLFISHQYLRADEYSRFVMDGLKKNPPVAVKRPPYPVKSGGAGIAEKLTETPQPPGGSK